MKVSLFALITGVGLLVTGMSSPAAAQQRSSTSASQPHRIGLVDVVYIFNHYEKMKIMRDQLQAEIQTAAHDPKITATKKQINSINSQLQKLKSGSQKAIELEQKMMELKAQLQLQGATIKRKLMRKEAEMYRSIYQEVANMVRLYAQGQNYTLVIRYHRDSPEDSETFDPRQLRAKLTQLVVYHQKEDDMTVRILKYMNKQYKKSQQTASAPTSNSSQ